MSDYRWLTNLSQQFLDKDYLEQGQSVDDRVSEICSASEKILKKPGFAEQLKDCVKKGWLSFSTPIWANFGTDRGLPISCFGSNIDDTTESILSTQAEVSMMCKNGGGTAANFSHLRGRGFGIKDGRNGTSGGSVHFMQLFDNDMNIWNQGGVRKGFFSAYLNIEHADINEFLNIRSEGHPIQKLSTGVCIPDSWMQSMIDGDKAKRKLWAKVLESRNNSGFPYLIFIDNVNNNTVDVYRNEKLLIEHSQMCTEIFLFSDFKNSFVCDLSSVNDIYFDEWKNTNFIELVVYFLDSVMTEFINKAKNIPFMERAVRFAENQRALGIGQLGWHSYLQSKRIAWESMEAKRANIEIAKNIHKAAYAASEKLAKEYGEPPLLKGYGRRNTTLLAIAPTKSSSFILGQASEGIQPIEANVVIKDLAKGKFTLRNKYLESLLEEKGQNAPQVWDNIIKHRGSVQQLNFLDKQEKDVFKTFSEISPMEIIIQAAQRQKYIDQGQSLNLMIHPSMPIKDVNALYIEGWKLGIKSFYYQINMNAAQEFNRSILTCSSCEA